MGSGRGRGGQGRRRRRGPAAAGHGGPDRRDRTGRPADAAQDDVLLAQAPNRPGAPRGRRLLNAAERYDWECRHVLARDTQDLDWYMGLARRAAGPVLEMACGTGRLAVPLGAVGLDIEPSMVATARHCGCSLVALGDMRAPPFAPHSFGLVVLAYNALQLLDADGRRACLAGAALVTRPDGMLALECTDFQAGVVVADVGPELLASHDGVELYGHVHHDLDRLE